MQKGKNMRKYVIERELSGIGNVTRGQALAADLLMSLFLVAGSQAQCDLAVFTGTLARFKKKLNRGMLCCAFTFV
jgi:hypothetical protein